MKQVKEQLYAQVALIGKVLASPKRLQLLELLCQGEKTVETLAEQSGAGIKLASAHLRELRHAHLVESRREGKYVLYRLASTAVADLWVQLREVAQERLAELRHVAASVADPQDLHGVDRQEILARARTGEVLVLDVRPADEYGAGHLPHARSIPLAELKKRLAELPKDVPVVAYCRGPFCFMARDAVALLRSRGFNALHLSDGVAEWRARGLPVETPA